MTTGGLLCAGGLLLAVDTPIDPVISQYGFVAIVVWFAVKELGALARLYLDRRARKVNGGKSDHDLLIQLRTEVESLQRQIDRLGG